MLRYLIRRILLAIPTLLVISLATFALSRYSDTDPVRIDYVESPGAYLAKARKLGLNQPQFYVSIGDWTTPDSLHRILPLEDRAALVQLSRQTGNWPASLAYFQSITSGLQPLLKQSAGSLRAELADLRYAALTNRADQVLTTAGRLTDSLNDGALRQKIQSQLTKIRHLHAKWQTETQHWKRWLPAVHWHGADNQYHRWLSGFLSGNPGNSIVTGNPLLEELQPRLLSTLLINGLALLLAYGIGVPLGVWMARHHQRLPDRMARTGLMWLYALPVMWLGSLLILLLSRPDTGLGLIDGLNATPWKLSGKDFFPWVFDNLEKFVLPVLTLSLHALAILAMQMRGGILEVIRLDYIRTARAKGLSERLVFWRHAFRNALFPVITIFANFFPALFSGSLVIEYLFDFPGMGIKMVSAFANNDYAVLFAMVMFVSVVTILGQLLADLLYAWADPRVRLGRKVKM